MDKLTSKFQLALQDAQSLALGRDHQFIEPAHLMIALLDQEGGSTRGLLTKADVNANQLRSKLGEALDRMPSVSGGDAGSVHVSNDLSKLLNVTDKIAQQRKDQYISSELFILCVNAARPKARSKKPSKGCAADKRSTTPTPKTNVKPSTNTPSTSPNAPNRARLTRSSGVTKKSAAWCKSCNAAPKTTPC
jgi:ATP-dependent Clp protease ATP-binding subunit ClpA